MTATRKFAEASLALFARRDTGRVTGRVAGRVAERVARRVARRGTGRGFAIAMVAGLALLGAALLASWSGVSAQALVRASVDDDPHLGTPCEHEVDYQAQCDLSVQLHNDSTSMKSFTIDEDNGVAGAFNPSTITPLSGTHATHTLADCPCTYSVPATSSAAFRLTIESTEANGFTWRRLLSRISIHAGDDATGALLSEYQLTLKINTVARASTITVGHITDTTISLSWGADYRATTHAIMWRPLDGSSAMSAGMSTDRSYTITGLTPLTLYAIAVQSILTGVTLPQDAVVLSTQGNQAVADRPQCPHPVATDNTIDYDQDDDGLIEICSLAQLDAIRYDLDGDGAADVYPRPNGAPDNYHEADFVIDGSTWHYGDFTQAERAANYGAVFSSAEANMGCNEGAPQVSDRNCLGYELAQSLDFDSNGNGLRDDTYNTGTGWRPIMGKTYVGTISNHRKTQYVQQQTEEPYNDAKRFRAVFEGNGHTISNLYVNHNSSEAGLFGAVTRGGYIRNLGLIGPTVRGVDTVGALVGKISGGNVRASYARDVDIYAGGFHAGGLAGISLGASFVETYATGRVYSARSAGGLISLAGRRTFSTNRAPFLPGQILASFASVDVTVIHGDAGGFVGFRKSGEIVAAYATGKTELLVVVDPYNPRGANGGSFFGNHFFSHVYWGGTTSAFGIGQVVRHSSNYLGQGGFAGQCHEDEWTKAAAMNFSYWDVETTGMPTTICGFGKETPSRNHLIGLTSAQLKAPTNANAYDDASIYKEWQDPRTIIVHWTDQAEFDKAFEKYRDLSMFSVHPDGGMQLVKYPTAIVDPWDFGTSNDYPVLDYCSDTNTTYCPLRAYHALPKVTIAADGSVAEGEPAVFTVSLDQALTTALDVYVLFEAETGVASPESQLGRRLVTFAAGSTSASVSVTTADDSVYTEDPSGQVHMRLLPTIAYTGAQPTTGRLMQATVDITENEVAPATVNNVALSVVSISGGNAVVEGDSVEFTITALPAPQTDLPVEVTIATDGDYGVTAGSRTVTIPTLGSATLTLTTSNDNVDETDGSVTATLVDGAAYNLGANQTATVNVSDNDLPPTVVSISGGNAVVEGGSVEFTVTALPAPQTGLPVEVTIATNGDYGVTAGSRTVTIPTLGSATLTLTTSNDNVDETDGSVTATLVDGAAYDLGANQTATVNVSDNDLPVPVVSDEKPTLSMSDASATEGDPLVFVIQLSHAYSGTVSVIYNTLASPTGAGADDFTLATEWVYIPPGQLSHTVSVNTIDDDLTESDELFQFELVYIDGATNDRLAVLGTIVDND